MTLYNWQEECLKSINGQNAIISAPTGSGKTRIAYIWMDIKGAIQNKHKIIYTVPIKALANEKVDELIRLYGKEYVGIETGDIKKRENSPILICTQEIYARKYAQMKQAIKLIIDEFHFIFTAKDRSRAYIDGIRYAQRTHNILILSATLGSPMKVKNYLQRTTGKNFVLYETDYRPTKLEFINTEFTLEDIPPFSLVYIFNIKVIEKICTYLTTIRPVLPTLKRRKIKRMADAYRINLEKFPEIFHGVAKYHSKLTFTEKRFIERLVREKFIDVIFATSALGVGINLPFEYVLFGNLLIPTGSKGSTETRPLTKIDFIQLAGRSGRKGYFDTGYVALLNHGFIPYETQSERRNLYLSLLNAPMEEPEIKLSPDVERIIKGKTTIEEEIDYIKKFSEPEPSDLEIAAIIRELTRIKNTVDSLRQEEREILKTFYLPFLSIDENIALAVTIASKLNTGYSYNSTIHIDANELFFITDNDEVKTLFKKKKVLEAFRGKEYKGKLFEIGGLEKIIEEIKQKDPLLFEVGEGDELGL